MTVATNLRRVQYVLNGVSTAFPVPFQFLAPEDLQVLRRSASGADTALILNVDFTVAGAGNPSGGTVTLASPGTSGLQLLILRWFRARS